MLHGYGVGGEYLLGSGGHGRAGVFRPVCCVSHKFFVRKHPEELPRWTGIGPSCWFCSGSTRSELKRASWTMVWPILAFPLLIWAARMAKVDVVGGASFVSWLAWSCCRAVIHDEASVLTIAMYKWLDARRIPICDCLLVLTAVAVAVAWMLDVAQGDRPVRSLLARFEQEICRRWQVKLGGRAVAATTSSSPVPQKQ